MTLDIRSVAQTPGEQQPFEGTISPEVLASVKGIEFATPVTLKGRLKNAAGVVTVEYDASFSVNFICDRCLAPITRSYELSFEHVVVREDPSEHDDYIVAHGDHIELDDTAVSDILLEMPTKVLCDENCKGLWEYIRS